MTNVPFSEPLALVQCGLLRADPRLSPMHHVVSMLSELLDVSLRLSLPQAAAKSSQRLVDRVLQRLLEDQTVSQRLLDFWFARAMQVALGRDDLRMIQHIHALHPAPLHGPDMLGLAFNHGTLETVQWVLDNRADRACCRPGISRFCRRCLLQSLKRLGGGRDVFRIVMWLFDCGLLSTANAKRLCVRLWAALSTSTVLIQWFADRKLLDQNTVQTLLHAAITGHRVQIALILLDVVQVPMPTSSAQVHLLQASFHGHKDVVEKLVSLGHCDTFRHKFVVGPVAPGSAALVQWDAASMNESLGQSDPTVVAMCCNAASSCGNLIALQWLFCARSIPPNTWLLATRVRDEEALLEIYKWMRTVGIPFTTLQMDGAAARGFLKVVQWLHAHSLGGCTAAAMDTAAGGGHLSVINWLQSNRSEGCTENAMLNAAEHGRLDVVQWFHDHHNENDGKNAMFCALERGHLDIVVWLADAFPQAVCPQRMRMALFDATSMEYQSNNVLRWIDALPARTCDACEVRRSSLLASAAESGDLELCEYSAEFHLDTMDVTDVIDLGHSVARNGHLGTLQWVYEACGVAQNEESWQRLWFKCVAGVARHFGHDHIVAWVHAVQAATR